MSVITGTIIDNLFEDMGCIVRLYNKYVITMITIIEVEMALEHAAFDDDVEQRSFLNALLAKDNVAIQSIRRLAHAEKTLMDNYIRNKVKSDIQSNAVSVKDILIDLGRAMETVLVGDGGPEDIDANELSTVGLIDSGNSGSMATIPQSITATRYFPTCRIILQCINVDTVDAEIFSVICTEKSLRFTENAVAGDAYTDSNYGLQFTISESDTPDIGDRLFIDITNSGVGTFDTFFSELYGIVLPGQTDASETQDDALAEDP